MSGSWQLLLVAPFVGSFLGVLIRRLPKGGEVVRARSACEACRRVLAVRDLLPLVSFAILGGRCRTCHAPIAWFHPAIELAATGVAVWALLAAPDPVSLWANAALGWTLLALAWIDWEHMMLPDVLTLPLLVGGLGLTATTASDRLAEHAAAAMLAYLAIRALAAIYRRLRGWEGLGQGDAKLLAAAGAWVGLAALPWVLLMGASATLAVMLAGAGWRGESVKATSAAPFGPGLCLAIWVVQLYVVPGYA